MKAIILAGGRGTRLQPVTDYLPKPLIPINNIPIIEWQLRYLETFGITKAVICTGYKQEMIKNYLDAKKIKIKVEYSVEKSPLGTGGAIKKAAKEFKEDSFLVINGDVITNIDLKRLLHHPNSIASIKLQTKFGVLEIENDKVVKFSEKKEIPNVWMNAGIYHLQKSILKDLPNKGDIEKTTFPRYANMKRLDIVKFNNVAWYSIDSFKDLKECSLKIDKIIKF